MSTQVQQIIDELVRNYQPEKVILFGSRVVGKTHKWSDIDLVVIKKTNVRFYNRIGEALSAMPYDIPIDVVVYTPEEFEEIKQKSRFIKKEVIGRGRIVYEQG